MLRSSPRYEHISVRSKLPENIVLLSELQADPDRIVARVVDNGAAVLLSHPGAPVAVLQSLSDYRKAQDERQFLRAVVEGLADLEERREVSLAEARARVSR
jgi:prevent-host-death family protein